jgi:riboflavin biosynthesis pyrimidine reductase
VVHGPRRAVRPFADGPGDLTLQRLYPDQGSVAAEEAYASLGLLERAPRDRPYAVANMIASADGRASLEGHTERISSDTDRVLFHSLRAQVDAVMVGTATIAIERYGPLARRPEVRERRAALGLPAAPLCVTASRSMELPVDTPLFQDPDSHVIVLTNSDREPPPCPCRLTVERLPGPELDLRAGTARLRERHGVRAMLLEGGPTLLAAMLDAEVVDEMFLSLSPLLVAGDEPSLLEGTALERPLPLRLVSLMEEESFLYVRYGIGTSQVPRGS